MRAKNLPEGKTVMATASHFVNHYKDHSFVIDYDEAIGLLGTDTLNSTLPSTFSVIGDPRLNEINELRWFLC